MGLFQIAVAGCSALADNSAILEDLLNCPWPVWLVWEASCADVLGGASAVSSVC